MKGEDAVKLSSQFYKVLENSKIRQNYDGVVFQTIWNMMQPDPQERCSWEEILQDPDLKDVIESIEKKYPGIVANAMKSERIELKEMINLEQSMEDISAQIPKMYGQHIDENGKLTAHLEKFN